MLKPKAFAPLPLALLAVVFAVQAFAADGPKLLVSDWYKYTGRRGMTGHFHVAKRHTGQELAPVEFVHDFVVNVKDKLLSLHLVTLCKDDAFYTPVKITSKGEGDDEFGNFTADIDWRKTDDGTVGTLTTAINGRKLTLALPERTITGFGLFEVVKQRPFKKDDVLKFHSLEASELNLKKDNTLTYVGEEEITLQGKAFKTHKFEQKQGDRLVTEFWLNEKRQLIRVLIDGDKEMVLTIFRDPKAKMEVILPKADAVRTPAVEDTDEIRVHVDEDNTISIDGETLTIDKLVDRMRALVKEDAERPVIISGHAKAKYSAIIRALNTCRKAKAKSVNFAASKKGAEAPKPKAADAPADSGAPAAGTVRKLPAERIVIEIDKDNTMSIKGKVLTLDQLREALRPFAGKKLKQPILITADRDAEWETVQDIIEMLNKLKFRRVSFATAKKPDK
ncbi:MAG: biopolymer transporter ExbD [Planctomycetota bacterium]